MQEERETIFWSLMQMIVEGSLKKSLLILKQMPIIPIFQMRVGVLSFRRVALLLKIIQKFIGEESCMNLLNWPEELGYGNLVGPYSVIA